MAEGRGFRKFIELVFDRGQARRTEEETQASLRRATDMDVPTAEMDRFARNARADLASVGKTGEGVFASLKSKIMGLAAGISALAVGKFIFDVNRETESLVAQLSNLEGSAEKGRAAFAAISEFASRTPFEVAELTKAFVILRGTGLQPAAAEMTAFGDLASSRGKSITDLAEAVTDAVTGEFERLKEFGVKAKQNGDRVSLTFKGQTTEIANTQDAISAYLVSIGQMAGVQGSMAGQMTTTNGLLSNMWDNFSSLARIIGEEGFNGEMKGGISSVNSFTGKLIENRAQIGYWVRVTIAGVKAIVATLVTPFKMLFNLGRAIGHSIEAMVSLMVGGIVNALAKGEGALNDFITELNKLPGVNIGLFSAMQRQAAIFNAGLEDDLIAASAAFSSIGDNAIELAQAYAQAFEDISNASRGAASAVAADWGGDGAAAAAAAPGAKGKKGKTTPLPKREVDDTLANSVTGLPVPAIEQMQYLVDLWREQHATMLSIVQDTASGVLDAWSGAFAQLFQEGQTLGGFLGEMFKSIGLAGLSSLAQYAKAKVAENIAGAFEAKAKATAAAANPLTAALAPGYLAAVGMHQAAAVKWLGYSALIGVASGGLGSIGGGGGGSGGGFPAPRDAGVGIAAQVPPPEMNVQVFVQPFNPNDPVQARGIGDGINLDVQLRGTPPWMRPGS
jgi:hypothetical protein